MGMVILAILIVHSDIWYRSLKVVPFFIRFLVYSSLIVSRLVAHTWRDASFDLLSTWAQL